MKRRDFFKNTSLAAIGSAFLSPVDLLASIPANKRRSDGKTAKNIIFMVSDGMSIGTLTMANLLLQRKEGRESNWVRLYHENKVRRAMMDTASANSLVTDSAAASSSWGGGVRVNNGSLNVGPDGTEHKPILQKFKAAGKSVGCVTSVPVTHATPAGFCINNNKRGDQGEIALQYLPLKFDIMLGGGLEYFLAEKRKDKTDLFGKYKSTGYTVLQSRNDLMKLSLSSDKPVMGVFYEDGLPYALDRDHTDGLKAATPSLAEMTSQAISYLRKNKKGFVMQVEGGKVDWSAHANDVGALLYDQIAFDEAIKVAIDFAEQDQETLVVITTDHGNANPGLFSGGKANENFDKIQHFKHTNEWILKGVDRAFTVPRLIERIEAAQGIVITKDEASSLLKHFSAADADGIYNPYKLPFRELAEIQTKYTSVGWGSMDHSGDYVEVAMCGPGSELLNPFVKNTELHNLMLEATGLRA
ncbi:alkaline phosphatase [Arcticibacter tournemirensis]|uniref:Alkaline phosphatase n=1 Tax=Arcticibacter tournemirensis TaxID=699437 RepID=A0A5M9H5M0_9SPHI|nr:alkaline phosphatase [Arcticibacter tournemirensis]KAA8481940.1 alkaline phosphatase [Arcticibacter tournemirensis]TQM52276.1 alkaline phosphatase [Arcticibacter tournemirensis]